MTPPEGRNDGLIMWTAKLDSIDFQTTKYTMSSAAGLLSFREVIDLWQTSPEFRNWFVAQLRESPFEAFFWETPAVTSKTLDRPFEFVLVQSATLVRLAPDPTPFLRQFASRGGEDVVTFPNLGGDAILVVPAPVAAAECYPHLAQFLRHGPSAQVDSFWCTVGQSMQERISNEPTWLSTAGLGVSWLHLRLDSQPKYYRHAPYKARPRS
jgi:hypothetical protein